MKSAREFDRIAGEIFAPAYPVIAGQIAEETGITQGICLDIGCGCGHLALAMARRTECVIRLLDPSPEMRAVAAENVTQAGLEGRMAVMDGSAELIPLEDNTVDLAVSRGSLFFWEDRVRAFREIYRVLKPRGAAYIGGGFGNRAIFEEISRKMEALDKETSDWRNTVAKRIGPESVSKFDAELSAAGIDDYRISNEPGKGLWIFIRKETSHDSL